MAQMRSLFHRINLLKTINNNNNIRHAATNRSGAILPEPKVQSIGLFKVFVGVALGLMIGATISKNVANFLEENELFVPSDDDDDDD